MMLDSAKLASTQLKSETISGPSARKVSDPHVRTSERPRLPDLPEGRFGRLFPDLPPHKADSDDLLRYGSAGGPLECHDSIHAQLGADNPRVPAGWPFFGQFVAHDITHDRTPLQQHEDVKSIRNFRSPRLDLECVYGAGPVGQPYLYERDDPEKLLIGHSGTSLGDLPRNEQGLAIVGDARNDTHLFISQLHLGFLHFHNQVVDRVRASGVKPDLVFETARQTVRWHYQWIIVREFLPLCVGEDLTAELLANGPRLCRFRGKPFIPVEFSDGAYRFGHAQMKAEYDVNAQVRNVPLFPDLIGTGRVTAERQVSWDRLFAFPDCEPPLASRRIGPQLVSPLMKLPEALVGRPEREEFNSLASRDLYRGRSVDLPSGEAVARAMGATSLSRSESRISEHWGGETPLWLYVLREAEVQQNGERLGEVGGRIVGEVLLELLRHDPTSFLAQPGWQPELGSVTASFGIADLLKFARVA